MQAVAELEARLSKLTKEKASAQTTLQRLESEIARLREGISRNRVPPLTLLFLPSALYSVPFAGMTPWHAARVFGQSCAVPAGSPCYCNKVLQGSLISFFCCLHGCLLRCIAYCGLSVLLTWMMPKQAQAEEELSIAEDQIRRLKTAKQQADVANAFAEARAAKLADELAEARAAQGGSEGAQHDQHLKDIAVLRRRQKSASACRNRCGLMCSFFSPLCVSHYNMCIVSL